MTELEPDQQNGIQSHRVQNRRWVFFFGFIFIQSIPVIYRIISLPGDPKNSLIFGLSLARILLVLAAAGLGLIFLAAAYLSGMNENRIQAVVKDRWCEGRMFLILMAGSILAGLSAWGFLVYLRIGPDGADNPLYIRFFPFLLWVILLGLQLSIWFWIHNFGWQKSRYGVFKPVLIPSAIVAGVFLLTGVIIGFTGWGVIPDIFYWGNPGVPLLSWQVWLALSSSLILLTLMVSFPVIRVYRQRLDWILGIGLFVLAAGLWLSQPIPSSYFFPSVRPPTYQIYPYSDAGFYDYTAQSLIIGEGFLNGKIVTRPLYILLVAIWHGLEGQDYAEIILLQTLLLAIFPAALYWLGRSMRSREAGLAAGLLAIFRELNTIAATPLTEVSHSKMLMTDCLTGLGLCLFCLAVFRWLRKSGTHPVRSVLIGGFLGLLILLRSQALFIVPVVVLLLLIQRKSGWRGVAIESGLFLSGIVLAVSPWIIRNGVKTGDFAMDQPSQAVYVAKRFVSSVEEMESLQLAANSSDVGRHIVQYTFSHPLDVARFAGAHFLNNELSTLVVLPLRASFTDFHDNFEISSLFWLDGVKSLAGFQWLFLALNLMLISIGVGSAWSKWKWPGLFPLLAHLAYSLSSAVSRISGWRFIQPVDWVGYFYFCLGFAEVVIWIFTLSNISLRPWEKNTRELPSLALSGKWTFAALGLILVAGVSLPAAEWIIPKRYSPAMQNLALERVQEIPELKSSIGSVEEFMQQPGAVQMVGRSLYPRWYKAGAGEPGSGWAAYKPREKAHLGFMIVGPSGDQQMVLTQDQIPENFTHAADLIVFGCKKSDFIDVRLVVGYNNPDHFVYTYGNPSDQCE